MPFPSSALRMPRHYNLQSRITTTCSKSQGRNVSLLLTKPKLKLPIKECNCAKKLLDEIDQVSLLLQQLQQPPLRRYAATTSDAAAVAEQNMMLKDKKRAYESSRSERCFHFDGRLSFGWIGRDLDFVLSLHGDANSKIYSTGVWHSRIEMP